MGAPQVLSLILSGRDSGMASKMKQMSARAISVATRTTRLSPYQADRYAPMAGLVTRLAANVADTWGPRGEKEVEKTEKPVKADTWFTLVYKKECTAMPEAVRLSCKLSRAPQHSVSIYIHMTSYDSTVFTTVELQTK